MTRTGPKKKWGQNFLRNPDAARRIADAVEPAATDVIVEIGPGNGALTRELVRLPNPIYAIEIDPDLIRSLGLEFGERVTIMEDDATEAPFPDRPYRAVGNLPYNVATPIMRRAVADPLCRRGVFMVQKEVADRLLAKPSEEPYGFLTLCTRIYADTRRLMNLGPGAFFPRPKVWSSVVVLDPVVRSLASGKLELTALISYAFRMRRKKLSNNLESYNDLTKPDVLACMERAGIGPDARAEELSLEQFDRLCVQVVARAT